MKIDLVFKNHTSQKTLGHSFFEKILKSGAKELKLKGKISVSVNLVGERRIKELNQKHRKKNKATDILSFPTGNKSILQADASVGSPTASRRGIPYSTFYDLGDMFICLSIAKSEAKRENITIKEKLAQLTAHGFLHLLGYDHEKSKRKAGKMFKMEGRVLGKIKF